jgi:hypothetical protein
LSITLRKLLDVETAHLWIADKVARIAWYQKLVENLDGHLADPDLDLRLRQRYTASLLHHVSDLKGELPTRTTVQVEAVPTIRNEIVGWNQDKWVADQMIERGWIPPSDEDPRREDPRRLDDGHSTTPEPAPARSPEPAPPGHPPPPAPFDEPVNRSSAAEGSAIFRSMSW